MGPVYGAHLHKQATEDRRANGPVVPSYPVTLTKPGFPIRAEDDQAPMSVIEDKSRLRMWARERRAAARHQAPTEAGERLRDNFVAAMGDMGVAAGVVSGYWPIADEIDVRPLMTRLLELGFACALPVVTAPGAPLSFRRWRPGAALVRGPFGTRHPEPGEPSLRPDIVLAPLLAFDDRGTRLGWGGGYYDRTIGALRRQGPVLTVGAAFAAQRVDAVPHAPNDRRLDWIVTEESWMRARP